MSGARTPEWEVLVGDCREWIKEIPDESVDSVVTDPPYELGFMNKKWDASGIAYDVALWREVLRVLKPGGHLLAFGGSRTYHRMTCAIEDAGFEVRDSLMWLYGTGFPKSLDVSKAIDKAAGVEREVTGTIKTRDLSRHGGEIKGDMLCGVSRGTVEIVCKDRPVTAAAAAWKGYGTALKPAHEPVVMARKPLIGTVAANVIRHGTGAINVDGCRVGEERLAAAGQTSIWGSERLTEVRAVTPERIGRWPANVLLDEEAAAALDEQSGERSSGSRAPPGVRKGMGFHGAEGDGGPAIEGSSGGASRFFYIAKTSRSEREAGCEVLPARTGAEAVDREEGSAGLANPRAGAGRTAKVVRNHHTTVKPISLMRYLVRLVTPPGGLILDPFGGSGTTGCAAVLEGFDCLLIEREPEYVEIIKARVAHWAAKGSE